MHLWVIAVRDGFVSLLPLTFLRVMAELARSLPWPAYQRAMDNVFGAGWRASIDMAVDASLSIFGVALAAIVAVQLAYRLPPPSRSAETLPPLMVSICAIIDFVLLAASTRHSAINFGLDAMLLGMIVGVASAELLYWAARQRFLNFVRLPYDTEATFYHAIRLSPPMIAIGLVMFAIAQVWAFLPPLSAHLLAPLADWAQAHGDGVWWLGLAATAINQVFWFVGIPGGLVLDAYAAGDLFAPAGAPYGTGLAWRPMFDAFVLLGGSGATLGLLLAIAFVAGEGSQRKIAKIALVPSLFNINDILLYGLPIILNPLYLLPFMAVPLLLALLAAAAAQSGLIHFQAVALPWTTPPILSGWMITDSWRGAALQIVGIGLSAAIYLPFVRRAEAERLQRQAQAFSNATRAILSSNETRQPTTQRQDQVGMIARGLLADLRADLARNALALAYQPKHDRIGRVVGVEALLRWTHARHGPVSPAVAVTLAEDSGDIIELGAWVLEQACACKARWNAAGYRTLTMAVNVSPSQLSDAELVPHLERCLQKYGLEPHEIELEIIESAVIPDSQVADQTLQQLAETGVHLAMDDFGMGYSSLLYLRRFHVHAIKIDGSLTRDVLGNGTNADIIRTITALGRAQQAEVVAEFVETLEQREALAHMGCDIFQGYFHSPPLSEAQCLDYFARHAASFAPPAGIDAAHAAHTGRAVKLQLLSTDAAVGARLDGAQESLRIAVRLCTTASQVRSEILEFDPEILLVDEDVGVGETCEVIRYVRDKLCWDWLCVGVLTRDAGAHAAIANGIPGRIDFEIDKPLTPESLEDRLNALRRRIALQRVNRSTLDRVAEGIIVIDEKGIVHAFNGAAETLFGWRIAEIVGRNISILIPPGHQEHHDEYLRNYERTGKARMIGLDRVEEALRKDGSRFRVRLKVDDISDGTAKRFLGVVQPVAE